VGATPVAETGQRSAATHKRRIWAGVLANKLLTYLGVFERLYQAERKLFHRLWFPLGLCFLRNFLARIARLGAIVCSMRTSDMLRCLAAALVLAAGYFALPFQLWVFAVAIVGVVAVTKAVRARL
jgi:hypothetical protein